MNTQNQLTKTDGPAGSLALDPCSVLLSLGWQEGRDQFRDYARMFYKRYATPTRCAGNDDKSGAQVCIYVSEFQGRQSIEMELRGGLSDGTWLKLHNYSLPPDVQDVLALIPRILAVWEAASSPNIPDEPTRGASDKPNTK